MLSSIVLLIVLTAPIALFSFSALGRAQSPTNGGIPVHQVSTGETLLLNNHSPFQIDRAVHQKVIEMVKLGAKIFLEINGTQIDSIVATMTKEAKKFLQKDGTKEIEEKFLPFIYTQAEKLIDLINKALNGKVNKSQMQERFFFPLLPVILPALIPVIKDVVIPAAAQAIANV
uniref:Uncharacterized protein n=1 Tax=Cacopsylla melanoneura TaxID=428564 RepID=A0A8D8QJG7_9HEMI